MSLTNVQLFILAVLGLTLTASAVPVAFQWAGTPSSGTVTGWALFAGSYDKTTKELHVRITHNLTDAIQAHVHGPAPSAFTAPGGQGSVAVGVMFTIASQASEATSPMTKVFNVSTTQEADLCGKKTYFNLHTTGNPSGAFGAVIFIDCDTPSIPFSFPGVGVSAANTDPVTIAGWYNPASMVIEVEITHQITDTVTAIHIHGPTAQPYDAPGSPYAQSAGVMLNIIISGDFSSPIRRSYQVSAANHSAICDRKTYFNIHTNVDQAGAYGAVFYIDCTPRLAYNFAGVPGPGSTNTGNSVFSGSLDLATRTLNMIITHPLTDGFAAHVHGSVATAFTAPGSLGGQSAGILETIGGTADAVLSPIIKSQVISQATVDAMCANKTYFAIHGTASPNGAFVSAIVMNCYVTTDISFSYTLFPSAAQTETVTASGTFNPSTRSFAVAMSLGVTPTAIHLHGPQNPPFTTPGSPFTNGANAGILVPLAFSGSSVDLVLTVTPNVSQAICDGRTYFNVHTTAAPNGAFGVIFLVDCVRGVVITSGATPTVATPTSTGGTPTTTATPTSTGATPTTTATPSVVIEPEPDTAATVLPLLAAVVAASSFC